MARDFSTGSGSISDFVGTIRATRFKATERGSATAPAFAVGLAGDTNETGIYSSSDSVLGVGAAGAARLTIASVSGFTTNLNASRFLAADDTAALPGHGWQNAAGGLSRISDGTGFDLNYAGGGVIGRVQSELAVLGSLNVTGAGTRWSGDISPAALTGDVTDWAPTGIASASRIRVDPGAAARVVNSVSGGADGRRLRFLNVSSTAGRNVTLLHDDGATGTAAMRFLCPNNASYVIPPNGSAEVEYDSTSSRWRVLGPVA